MLLVEPPRPKFGLLRSGCVIDNMIKLCTLGAQYCFFCIVVSSELLFNNLTGYIIHLIIVDDI